LRQIGVSTSRAGVVVEIQIAPASLPVAWYAW
jgi:hypothetical protein